MMTSSMWEMCVTWSLRDNTIMREAYAMLSDCDYSVTKNLSVLCHRDVLCLGTVTYILEM